MTQQPTFDVSDGADAAAEPVPFTLRGVYAADEYKSGRQPAGATWVESFQALPIVPMSAAAGMAEAFFVDQATGRRQINPAAVIGFIRDALPEDDARRFMGLVYDKTRLIKLTVLTDVMTYLGNSYTDRPTGLPSPSTGGGGSTGNGAAAGAWPTV